MTEKPKFLEFEEQKVHNDFWHLIREKASETEVLAAQKQHSRDRIIMEKLLDANRMMRECLVEIEKNKIMTIMNDSEDYMEGAHGGYGRQAETAFEGLIKADEIMKGVE